jgi:hypothetical protein
MRTVSGGGCWDLKSREEGMRGTNKFLEESASFTGVAVCPVPFSTFLFPLPTTSSDGSDGMG